MMRLSFVSDRMWRIRAYLSPSAINWIVELSFLVSLSSSIVIVSPAFSPDAGT